MTVGEAKYTYWRTMLEIASASGMEKEEWCRRNCVSIKTFQHYEGIFRRQDARKKAEEEQQAETPFYEIPMRDLTDNVGNVETGKETDEDIPYVDEECGLPDQADGQQDHGKEPGRQNTEGMRLPQLAIETGSCRVLVYEGAGEDILRTVMKVMGVGHA